MHSNRVKQVEVRVEHIEHYRFASAAGMDGAAAAAAAIPRAQMLLDRAEHHPALVASRLIDAARLPCRRCAYSEYYTRLVSGWLKMLPRATGTALCGEGPGAERGAAAGPPMPPRTVVALHAVRGAGRHAGLSSPDGGRRWSEATGGETSETRAPPARRCGDGASG